MLERIVETGLLFDLYQALLTPRQRDVLSMRMVEDLSLAEVAEELHITRQAVYDTLQRTVAQLHEYEALLGLLRAQRLRATQVAVISEMLGSLMDVPPEAFVLLEELI
ncbi:MAG: hypothetical protein OWT28_13560 [Firmicutes bacterium]|nr:hypothetical protein [Bacillota bacterium]